ncbi:hypothetical protein K1719_038702 [Acacia pycnantha]|nr:hypothetical protein K1719_038702 [Acacia pycnantha]
MLLLEVAPLRKITDKQEHALKMALEAKGLAANLYVAMRYWYPFTEEAVQKIKRDGITKLVYLAEARKGSRLRHDSLVDGMLKDGLWDVFNDCDMGTCAELCADKHEISRDDQESLMLPCCGN